MGNSGVRGEWSYQDQVVRGVNADLAIRRNTWPGEPRQHPNGQQVWGVQTGAEWLHYGDMPETAVSEDFLLSYWSPVYSLGPSWQNLVCYRSKHRKTNTKSISTPYLVPGRDGASKTHEQVAHGHETNPYHQREKAEQLLKHGLDAHEDEDSKENRQGSWNCY